MSDKAEKTSDKHYEDKFEFPLWKLIQDRAEEKGISYAKAAPAVVAEYSKTIKYREPEFEDKVIMARAEELNELGKKEEKLGIKFKDKKSK